MSRLTHYFKRSRRHPLMKAQATTLVSIFLPSLWSRLVSSLKWISCDCRYLPSSAGQAVTFTRQYLLTPPAGRRPRVPVAVVIIADRKSADNLTLAASSLRATGVQEHWAASPESSLEWLALMWLEVTTCSYHMSMFGFSSRYHPLTESVIQSSAIECMQTWQWILIDRSRCFTGTLASEVS